MESYKEVITPDKAKALLSTVKGNRSIISNWVNTLARDMLAKRWELSPQGIVLDEDGNLIDGQHRLTAVVQANIPVEFWVTDGWPRDTFRQIDGGRMRSMSDRLKIGGFEDATQLAAIARHSFYWDAGQFWTGRTVPSREELQGIIDTRPMLRKAASIAHNGKWASVSLPASIAGFAWYLFQEQSAEDANWAMDRLRDGAGLDQGNGILTARNRLLESRVRVGPGNFTNPRLKLAWVVRGWNAYRDNERLSKIQVKNPLSNESFPVPH